MSDTMEADLGLGAEAAETSIFGEMAEEVSGYLYEYRALRDWGVRTAPFLDFLMELLQKILPMLLTCLPMAKRNADGLLEALKNPNLWMRLVMRQEIRAKLRDEQAERALLNPMASAMLRMGAGMTKEKTTKLMAA